MGRSRSRSGLVQSLDRGLEILETMAREGSPLGVSDLAARLGMDPSTVHRLLHTMKARDFVRQDGDRGLYSLGLRAFQVGSSVLFIDHLRRVGRRFLHHLAEEVGETSNLAILDGQRAVYIEQEPGPQFVRTLMEIGRPLPLFCTAVGRVLLAGMRPVQLEQCLADQKVAPLTPKTLTDRNLLRDELKRVMDQGYAVEQEEFELGHTAIASPVLGAGGETLAAISLGGPSSRFNKAYIRKTIPVLRDVAMDFSRAMGWSPTR